jgi:ligand-binding sensor domain-containing protein
MPKFILLLLLLSNTLAFSQKGLLSVNISGAPAGANETILMSGPNGFSKTLTRSETFSNLASGTYEFKSEIIIQRQPFISQAFRLDKLSSKISVKNDTQRVNLTYRLMPGSDKLWVGNQNAVYNTSTKIIAFNEDALRSTQTSNATAKLTDKVTSARGMAFDRFGNLWLADAYSLKMFDWNSLGKSNALPKVVLNLKEPTPCIVFDAAGNVWISNGRKIGVISRIPFAQLYASGAPTADIVLSGSGINDVQGMAFDANGNLWITHKEKKAVIKLNAAAITTSSTTVEAAVTIICESKPPVTMTLSGPAALAFDKQGNLWVGYFGPNVIARIAVSEQNTSATITPEIQLSLTVGVILHSLAFDEDGSLCTALATGKFGKFSPSQLTSAGKKIPDVIIICPELKYATGLAFYPLPEGLPLK